MDEFLERTREQDRTYIIGQIESPQNQIKSAIQSSNDVMVAFNKLLIDTLVYHAWTEAVLI